MHLLSDLDQKPVCRYCGKNVEGGGCNAAQAQECPNLGSSMSFVSEDEQADFADDRL
jgi:hypothetical protein